MPLLGADMEAGTLVQWLKQPGDSVKRGDVIAVVDTAKGAIEIEVFEDGVVESLRVQPGEKVPVGTVLAMLQTSGAPASPGLPAPPALPAREHHVRASPAARKIAADLGLDLARVTGTGSEDAITLEDVERASAALKPPDAGTRAAAMRTAIAAAMARSKRDIPHYYLSTTIDMTAPLDWMRAENAKRPMEDRLLPVTILLKAVALALREVPELNGRWVEGAFRKAAGIHVGCAVSLRGGGLVAPALHDADLKDLGALMREMRDIVARARAGSLRSSELSDPTITVTNLGDRGVDAAFGIIYPPQVALVGFGRIAERPWAAAGKIEARPLVTVTLKAEPLAAVGVGREGAGAPVAL